MVSLVVTMFFFYFIFLCLVQCQVHAIDWLNRTVRVDLITERQDFKPHYVLHERWDESTNVVEATNGKYPWSVMTTAWSFQGGFGVGTTCSGSIISDTFVLSDLFCVRRNTSPPVSTIEVSIGSVSWNSTRSPSNFVRHYWFITSTAENSPRVVLFRLHETLTFTPNVQPIRLPSHESFSYEAWTSYTLGLHTPGNGPFSAQLLSVQTRVLNSLRCTFNGNVPDHEFCGIDGRDPSQSGPVMRFNGFSGGAWIVYEYKAGVEYSSPVIIGINQYQFANQTASFGYASRVSFFVDWIKTLSVE